MKKKHYIFLTLDGYTFQPDSKSVEPDIENLLVLKQARYNKKRAIRDRNAPNLLVIIRSVGNAITKERGISSEQNI